MGSLLFCPADRLAPIKVSNTITAAAASLSPHFPSPAYHPATPVRQHEEIFDFSAYAEGIQHRCKEFKLNNEGGFFAWKRRGRICLKMSGAG